MAPRKTARDLANQQALGRWLLELRRSTVGSEDDGYMTQEEVAAATRGEVHRNEIGRWENGHVLPGTDALLALFDVYEVTWQQGGREGRPPIQSPATELRLLREAVERNETALQAVLDALRVIAPADKQGQLDPILRPVRAKMASAHAAIDESAMPSKPSHLREHGG